MAAKFEKKFHSTDMSEYDVMKSVGITLGGPDPLQQQLHELDAQSRIMCGLINSTSNNSKDNCDTVYITVHHSLDNNQTDI